MTSKLALLCALRKKKERKGENKIHAECLAQSFSTEWGNAENI